MDEVDVPLAYSLAVDEQEKLQENRKLNLSRVSRSQLDLLCRSELITFLYVTSRNICYAT